MKQAELILETYLNQVILLERILSKTFNFNTFKELDKNRKGSAYKYARTNLKLVGYGSSRDAYLLTPKSVLKIATGDGGSAQNYSELRAYTNPQIDGDLLFAKILDYDTEHGSNDVHWLVSELVRPIKNYFDFRAVARFDFDFVMQMTSDVSPEQYFEARFKELKEPWCDYTLSDLKKVKSSPFFNELLKAVDLEVLTSGDLKRYDQWGKTADGRIVVLDYGLTRSIYKKFFQNKKDSFATDTEHGSSVSK